MKLIQAKDIVRIGTVCTALVSYSLGEAQQYSFEVYTSRELGIGEGTFKLPITVSRPVSEQFNDYLKVTKAYTNAMSDVASRYLGFKRNCTVADLVFLPGKTESSVREAERILNKTFTTAGYKRSTGETGRMVVMKTVAPRSLAPDLTGSFYILKPSVYPRDSTLRTQYVFGYFFDKKLKQGALITCTFFPSLSP